MAVVILYFIISLLVAVLQCRPAASHWDKSIKNGSCIHLDQSYQWNSVVNLLIDFIIWSLALPVTWKLNLNTRQRLSLSLLFLLGLM